MEIRPFYRKITIGLFGYLKMSRVMYLFTMLFLLGNEILSLTDQVGLFDAIPLVLSLGPMLLSLLQWEKMLGVKTWV